MDEFCNDCLLTTIAWIMWRLFEVLRVNEILVGDFYKVQIGNSPEFFGIRRHQRVSEG